MTAQEAVGRLLDGADLLLVGGAAWILAPVTPPMIDALAGVGADTEDAEIDDPTESNGDDEDEWLVGVS